MVLSSESLWGLKKEVPVKRLGPWHEAVTQLTFAAGIVTAVDTSLGFLHRLIQSAHPVIGYGNWLHPSIYPELCGSCLLALFGEFNILVFVTIVKLWLVAYCLAIFAPKRQTLSVPPGSSSIGLCGNHPNEHLGWLPEIWAFKNFFFCKLLTRPTQTSNGKYIYEVDGRSTTLLYWHLGWNFQSN